MVFERYFGALENVKNRFQNALKRKIKLFSSYIGKNWTGSTLQILKQGGIA
jgi:hypothetical protein